MNETKTLEFFRNEILAKRPKCWTDSYFWIHEFRDKDHFKQIFVEVILFWFYKFINKYYFNIQVFLPGRQAARISFRKTSVILIVEYGNIHPERSEMIFFKIIYLQWKYKCGSVADDTDDAIPHCKKCKCRCQTADTEEELANVKATTSTTASADTTTKTNKVDLFCGQ